MPELLTALGKADLIALSVFILLWLVFELAADYSPLRAKSMSGLMSEKRREWMLVMANRDLRMIDTQIIAGLQQGAAFFASATIFAIGGCFALLGSTDMVLQIYQDLPMTEEFSRAVWEVKVLGLALLFAYTFFKFGWSYRVFNYCSILVGAVPHGPTSNAQERERCALRAANMNIIAGRHFTAGQRGIFFALAYMGWFVGPKTMIVSSVFVLLILIRRQFFSQARAVLLR
jgi:uncharacterized membrane protein